MEKKTDKIVKEKKENSEVENVKVNPLRNERVYIRFVPQENGEASKDKGHVLYGGFADGSNIQFCVPILRSGVYKNILTNDEMEFLEKKLGLDFGALSVYKKENNYWDDYKVNITKEGLYLDLSDPEDYIRYKVLLANNDKVAPSVKERTERPKVTYRFEVVREHDETMLENAKMDATMASYMKFGEISHDLDTMRVLVEQLDGRPYDVSTKPEFLRSRINILIQSNPKNFLEHISDPLLHSIVIIRRATELGKVVMRGDYYYLASGEPMCENGQRPSLKIAAQYINLPDHQDVKFTLESEVDKHRIAQ